MALRGAQQRITPDVQIGCISCASGDGKFGQPVWWNTPLDEDDVAADVATDARAGAEQHRAQWGQQVCAVRVLGWLPGSRNVNLGAHGVMANQFFRERKHAGKIAVYRLTGFCNVTTSQS